MSDFLPFMKNVLTPLAKRILIRLGLRATSGTDVAIQKRTFWIRNDCIDNVEQRNGRYHENS